MNKKDKVLMDKHNITAITKTVFLYKDFKYERLDSAVRYAEHEQRKIPARALRAAEL